MHKLSGVVLASQKANPIANNLCYSEHTAQTLGMLDKPEFFTRPIAKQRLIPITNRSPISTSLIKTNHFGHPFLSRKLPLL